MASKPAVRSLQSLARRSRPICECANASIRAVALRQMSTGTYTPMKDESMSSGSGRAEAEAQISSESTIQSPPRWSQTPPRMKAPFPFRIKDNAVEWKCNDDPQKLDQFYEVFLGQGGDTLLTEEVKWLAVTHKSFDQGRRGFNDRLAFLGRRILNLQLNLALLNSSVATKMQRASNPEDKREPFKHPALDSLRNVSDVPIDEILTKQRLAGLASQMGMQEIIRWVPRNVKNLEASGLDVVLTASIYAIIGALSLQRGGAVAADFARKKVLKPLGIS